MFFDNKNYGFIESRGHHFYANVIDFNSVVIDLGSHLGEFSQMLISRFDCFCYSIEALPNLYDQIPNIPKLKKFNYAINDNVELLDFVITENQEGNYIRNIKINNENEKTIKIIQVQSITLDEFLRQQSINQIDLLKVDIEGAEFNLFDSIDDSLLSKIKQITVEFHDFKFKGLKSQVKNIKLRLQKLGFVCINFSITTNGDVLFVNRNLVKIADLDIFYVKYIGKFIEGIKRKLKRRYSILHNQPKQY